LATPRIFRRWARNALRSSFIRTLCRPCFRAFWLDVALPRSVRGPVLLSHGWCFRAAAWNARGHRLCGRFVQDKWRAHGDALMPTTA
jgi:hypothetical protein